MGGTDDGFLVWLDRPDTQFHLMGDDENAYSSQSATVGSGSSLSSIVLSGSPTLDTALEGIRGQVLRYVAAGTEYAVRLLSASNKTITFDEQATVTPTVSGDVTIGAQVHRWDSGWLDCDNPQQLKNALYLDAVAKQAADGELRFLFYKDFDTTTAIDSKDMALTLAHKQVNVEGLDGRWFQVSVRSVPLTTKASVSLSSLLLRLYDIDQD